jgi:uncharacterized membrane-anchored protein
MFIRSIRFITALLAAAALVGFARAADPPPSPKDAARDQAIAEADKAALKGPTDVELAGQAVLHLPAGRLFVPQPQAGKLLNAMGNPGQDPRLQGVVFPGDDGGWFAVLRYEDAGHVKDDDAKDWNADDLLKSYKDGTEANNKERKQMGVPELEILGWAEKPAYDAATHRLAWAMSSRHKGDAAGAPQGVNYNTYALGREGYFSVNLVTALAELPQHKPAAHDLLAALQYKPGRAYADYDQGTDRNAEYGLAALVVGVAAKKLGFLALAAAFFAKFAKVILVGLALAGGAVAKFWRRKPKAGS